MMLQERTYTSQIWYPPQPISGQFAEGRRVCTARARRVLHGADRIGGGHPWTITYTCRHRIDDVARLSYIVKSKQQIGV